MSKRIGPGPARYGLPTTIGFDKHDTTKQRRPQFSFGYRPPTKYSTMGPGPITYNVNTHTRYGKHTRIEYTLAKRLNPLRDDQIPGPGAHDNHLCPLFKERRMPEYSMARRVNEVTQDKVPGPNSYLYGMDMYKPRMPSYFM